MHAECFETRALLPTLLTVPGLDGSGPEHWQSLWEDFLPDCRRVEMADWSRPVRERWVERLDDAVVAVAGPVVLVAHSLGCLATAWWAGQKWRPELRHKLLGAMLVAPPCVEGGIAADRIADFRPAPRQVLPFPTIVVASRDDPYASFDTATGLAQSWGSQLVDIGHAGHINAQSGLGIWEQGVAFLESLLTSTADARRTVRTRRERMDAPYSGTRPDRADKFA